MRRTWIGTAAAAALATAFAIPVAFAQETHQGQQAPTSRESSQHGQMGQGMGERAGQPGAQAQTSQSRMSAEPGQEQNPRERGQAGKPGMKGESAQTREPTNRAQSGKPEGERGKSAQIQQRQPEPQGQSGKAAQAQEHKGRPENGQRAEQTGSANQNRAGQAQTEMQNRQGAAQMGQSGRTGQSGKPITAQTVQTMGKTNLPHDKAAKVAQTLMASGGAQTSTNININEVRVGASLPADVVINPLPETIVELVPAFRGYDYIVVNDEIVIIDPSTRQVVEIIEAVG